MQMVFGANDEKKYYAARDVLIQRFTDWLIENPAGDQLAQGNAELVLDWKWGYSDGDLSLWTLAHFDELLLEWFPRKVMIASDEAEAVLTGLAAFMQFMHESRLMSRRSSSAPSIATHLRQLEPPFRRALSDRSRHGMGKSLFGAMSDLGMTFDPEDPSSIASLMDSFNALSFEERGAILGIDDDDNGTYQPALPRYLNLWVQLIAGIDLPPARAMTAVRRDELSADTTAAEKFALISSFFDRPRKLTKTGNLTIADGLDFAELLDSNGDVRTSHAKIRSSEELPGLGFWFDLAKKCGVIKSLKGTMSSTASSKKRSAADLHERAVAVLLKYGPLAYGGHAQWRNHDVEEVIDGGLPALLAVLFALDGAPIPYSSLLLTTQEIVRESITQNSYKTALYLDSATAELFNELWQLLQQFGAIECIEYSASDDVDPFETPTGDVLDGLIGVPISAANLGAPVPSNVGLILTELGQVVVAPYLASLGMEVPEVGVLTHRPLPELIARVSDWHRSRIKAEFVAWVVANGAELALTELTQLARSADDVQERVAIVELAASLPGQAEHAVRGLLPTKVSGHAMVWLLTHELEQPNDDNMRQAMLASFELLSLRCLGEPDDDIEFLSTITTIFESLPPAEFCELLWRVDELWAGDVLAAVGRLHPDKSVAKQARKAVMQHHTYLANLRK